MNLRCLPTLKLIKEIRNLIEAIVTYQQKAFQQISFLRMVCKFIKKMKKDVIDLAKQSKENPNEDGFNGSKMSHTILKNIDQPSYLYVRYHHEHKEKLQNSQSVKIQEDINEHQRLPQKSSPKKKKKIQKNVNRSHSDNVSSNQFNASNAIKKLNKIISDAIQNLNLSTDFRTKYFKEYSLNHSAQNILIIPIMLIPFFIQELQTGLQKDQSSKFQDYIQDKFLKFKITISQILNDFKNSLMKKNQRKLSRQKGKIGNSVEIVQQLAEAIPFHFQQVAKLKFKDLKTNVKSNNFEVESQVKVQDENCIIFTSSEQKLSQQSKFDRLLNKYCQDLNKLIIRKARNIQEAKLKFISIVLNEPDLRLLFEIDSNFHLNVKQYLIESVRYIQAGKIGKMKDEYQSRVQNFYSLLESNLLNEHQLTIKIEEDFFVAFMSILLLDRKIQDVLKQFMHSIQKTIYFLDQKASIYHQQNSITKLTYGKSYYQYFVGLLKRLSKTQSQKIKHQNIEQQNPLIDEEEWIFTHEQVTKERSLKLYQKIQKLQEQFKIEISF